MVFGLCKISALPLRSLRLLRNSQVQALRENNKRSIEQVGKGGLPPPVPNLHTRETAGVNHPSLLVQF